MRNKKVHFYLPRTKVDVENQTFFDNTDQFLYDENIYERQYQSSINSLLDQEPPENEIEKMIKYDYSSRIAFYLTRLHDDRFEPLTPTEDIFSNCCPKLCLEIRNEGFTIWNCSNKTNASDNNNNSKNYVPHSISLSYDNDANVIQSIIDSFTTEKINSSMLRLLDKLRITYSPLGNILCEIADYRFNPETTYLSYCDDNNIYRKRINLQITNTAIYYLFTLAKQSFNRSRNVHLNASNNDSSKSSSSNKSSNVSISLHPAVPNISSETPSHSTSISIPNSDSFYSIKKNESTPNLLNPNFATNQPAPSQPREDKVNINFNAVKTENPTLLPFQSEPNPMIINIQNKNFINEPYPNQMNEYIQNQTSDQPFLPMTPPPPNPNIKDNTFQIPIQRMSSKPIPNDPQVQLSQQQNLKQQQQQLQKQLQQLQKTHNQHQFQKQVQHLQKQKQQLQQHLQMQQQFQLQQQQLQQIQQFQQQQFQQQHFQQQQQQQTQQQQKIQQQQQLPQQQKQIQQQLQQQQQFPQQQQQQIQQPQLMQQQAQAIQQQPQKTQQMQKQSLQKHQKQQTQKQRQSSQQSISQVLALEKSEALHIDIQKRDESPSKSKGKSHAQQSPPNVSAFYETEGSLTLLLHPTFCCDPSPDVCRALSILDFRKKMWNESQAQFNDNFSQMKTHFLLGSSESGEARPIRQKIQIRPPKDKIVVPETISQMFISKNMPFKFNSY
ncbi:hypothetical protein M9Y10_022253 [Tritrichomonas musculus]|uniref:Uncharacterized protein n=1 Tax=Tritrichomonas musculus TaxID=1915356 RepID=A0ABR2KRX4_9EUKA